MTTHEAPGPPPLHFMAPSPRLRPFVQTYWRLQQASESAEDHALMHPDGGTSLLFNFGHTLRFDGNGYAEGAAWRGASKTTCRLALATRLDALGVHLRPAGAYALLKPMAPPLQEDGAVNDALRDILASLHDRVACLDTPQAQTAYLDAWFTQRLASGGLPSRRVSTALALIDARHGWLSIDALAEAVCLSRRALEQAFRRQVGLSPKHYARLCRLARARQWLKRTPNATQASVAQGLGYHDEAHFIRDFKRTVGLTPGAYRARHRCHAAAEAGHDHGISAHAPRIR